MSRPHRDQMRVSSRILPVWTMAVVTPFFRSLTASPPCQTKLSALSSQIGHIHKPGNSHKEAEEVSFPHIKNIRKCKADPVVTVVTVFEILPYQNLD